MNPTLRILYQDEWVVAIDKPAGFYSHAPDLIKGQKSIPRSKNAMLLVRDQIQKWVYPVHRLDRATSGVLIYALSSESAAHFQATLHQPQTQKSYLALLRGLLSISPFFWDSPLKNETGQLQEAITHVFPLSQVTWPYPIGKYPEAKYTLCLIRPKTGRMHQIRRHAVRASHPIVGDTIYGDGKHNRLFKEKLGQNMSGLFLKAWRLRFCHPFLGTPLLLQSKFNPCWHQVFDQAGICPMPDSPPQLVHP